MPWSARSAMDQKRLFIKDYMRDSFSMAELCRRYGISRPTGYKWVDRFEVSGLPGLEERSRRPKGCSHETAIEITEAILELRRKHPYWGAITSTETPHFTRPFVRSRGFGWVACRTSVAASLLVVAAVVPPPHLRIMTRGNGAAGVLPVVAAQAIVVANLFLAEQ